MIRVYSTHTRLLLYTETFMAEAASAATIPAICVTFAFRITCLAKTAMSSLKESEEQTSPPATPGSLGVHVANSHFSKTSASSGNNGWLQEGKHRLSTGCTPAPQCPLQKISACTPCFWPSLNVPDCKCNTNYFNPFCFIQTVFSRFIKSSSRFVKTAPQKIQPNNVNRSRDESFQFAAWINASGIFYS